MKSCLAMVGNLLWCFIVQKMLSFSYAFIDRVFPFVYLKNREWIRRNLKKKLAKNSLQTRSILALSM